MKHNTLKEPLIVVEDEKDIGEYIADIAQQMGYSVQVFQDPLMAMEALKEVQPFLIISDFRMPKLNGFEFCTKARAIYPTVNFVIATGFADKAMVVSSIQYRVSDFIEKPFREEALSNLIKKFADTRLRQIEEDRRETEEIAQLFIEESREIITDVDKLILRLEESPLDPAVIDLLFRKIHTVKGGAGAVSGAKALADLGHEFESNLSLIKKGALKPNQLAINLFLTAYDLIQRHLDALKLNQTDVTELLESTKLNIAQLVSLKSGKESEVAQTTPAGLDPSQNLQKPSPLDAQKNTEDEGIWVTNERLDALMKVSGELVAFKNALAAMTRDQEVFSNPQEFIKKLTESYASFGKISDRLQGGIMDVRKVTLERAFGKLPRMIRQLSQELKKQVVFEMNGMELGIDKSIAKALTSSLTHLIRNSLDHGLESADQRRIAGKPETGLVTLSASQRNGIIYVLVSDDGGGIYPEKVKASAVKKGLISQDQAQVMSDSDAIDLIFHPGFSTVEKVSNVSGRGVGMDVVRSSVMAIGGKVKIQSTPGKGLTVHIEIPLPQSVVVEQTILVKTDDTLLAIPFTAVSKITPVSELMSNEFNGLNTCQFLGKTIKLGDYKQLLFKANRQANVKDESMVVILEHKNRNIALMCDSIHEQLEAVVRPFDRLTRNIRGFKGTTSLSGNRIAYVIEAEQFVDIALGSQKLGEQAA